MPKSIYDGQELGQGVITGVGLEVITIAQEIEPDMETHSRRFSVAHVVRFINGELVSEEEFEARAIEFLDKLVDVKT